MVLEDLLHRPCMLARYRLPPLGAELDGFCNRMDEQGYSHSSIQEYAARISQFNLFLRRRGVTAADQIEEDHAERFIARRRRTHGRDWLDVTQRVIRLLMRYLTDRGVLESWPKAPTPCEELLDRYAQYLRNGRGLAASTVRSYSFYLKSFIKALDQEDLPHAISALTPQDVQAFFCECAQGKATRTRGYIRVGLRHFFAFCAIEGYAVGHLAEAVPRIYSYRLADVPRQIPDMLGHRDINSTLIYTKVDFRTLADVPLDWPGGEP